MTVDAARFVTIEGIEGVGKSTQVERLAAALRARGIELCITREPGGTPLAEEIRALVLAAHDESMPPAAELLLMFAARAVHLSNLVEPALHRGQWVLCDRFTDATYAYQGAGRDLGTQAVEMLENYVQGARRPDLTFLLDMPVALALERVHRRGAGADRFEAERAEFFERVRSAYLARAAAEPRRIRIVDANRAADEVARTILAALREMAWIS